MIAVKMVQNIYKDVDKIHTGKKKDIFNIKPVKPKDIAGAGLTLSVGYIVGPFIPFKKLKNWRFK